MAGREKLGGSWKYQKNESLENKKSFLAEIKSIFHNDLKIQPQV